MNNTLRLIVSLLIASISSLVTIPSGAQEYPSKPIKLIVPNTAGSTVDVMARVIGAEMSKYLGQPIVVENKPGANNLIGLEYVAKQAPADGYTIVLATIGSMTTLPLTVKDARFDPMKDLPPITTLAEYRYALVSSSRAPWKTFNEMVAQVKSNPDKFNYGTSGLGGRLNLEMLIREAGLQLTHIPYPSSAPFMQGLGSGDIQLGLVGEADPPIFGDKARTLALTGDQRSAAYPDVPTFAELGYPRIRSVSFSLNVAAGTPKPIIDKLHDAASRALRQPDVKTGYEKLRMAIVNDTPDAAAVKLAEEGKSFSEIAKLVGIKPQ